MDQMLPPRRSLRAAPALVAVALLLLAACFLHREVIFGGSVYHMDDAADGYYPGHIAVARAFARGELPTWEEGSWCGWPLVVDPYNGVFYLPNVIYYLVGAARGLGYSIVLHILLGGAGMWLLLRRRRLSFEAALFGALAYSLSTFGVVRIRHVIFVQMIGWLPWILVGVEGWIATRRRRELVLVAAATGLALIAGALSIGHFAALVIAGYTVGRCIGGKEPAEGRPPSLRRTLVDLGALGGAAVIGALLAAVQLAPTLAHLAHSPRSLGSDYAFASSYAWPDWTYLATLVMPDLFGGDSWRLNLPLPYFGAPNHHELTGWYVGALCALLALFGLLRPRPAFDTRRRGAELWALALLVALAIALAFGDAGPIHRFFYYHLPLYAALRCPSRALLIALLALPILGAHGVEALLERARSPGGRWIAAAAWIGATVIALAGAFAWHRIGKLPAGATAEYVAGAASGAHLAWVAAAGLAVLLLALAGAIPRRIAGLLLALALTVDLIQIDRGYLQPQPADHPSGMERFAAVEWLLQHQTGDRFVNDPAGPFRLHNVGMVLDLENASGYDSVPIWRYVEFLHLLKTGRRYPWPALKEDLAAIGVHNLRSRMVDLMNVRWLLAEQPPDARWALRFRPPAVTGAPAARFEPSWDQRMKVFENTTVMPRAFVAYRASVPGSDEALGARLTAPGFDPGAEIFLEEPPGIEFGPPRPYTAAKRITTARHHLVIEADAAAPGILFVGDAFYPGWSATVDGAPAKLLRADYAFRGVALPAGHHRVEMTYTSRPVAVGGLLSLAALLSLLFLGGWAGRLTRRVRVLNSGGGPLAGSCSSRSRSRSRSRHVRSDGNRTSSRNKFLLPTDHPGHTGGCPLHRRGSGPLRSAGGRPLLPHRPGLRDGVHGDRGCLCGPATRLGRHSATGHGAADPHPGDAHAHLPER